MCRASAFTGLADDANALALQVSNDDAFIANDTAAAGLQCYNGGCDNRMSSALSQQGKRTCAPVAGESDSATTCLRPLACI